MQDTQTTKAKKFICRLKLIGIKKPTKPVIIPIPEKEKPKSEKKPLTKKRNKEFYLLQIAQLTKTQKRDYDFYRFSKRLDIKLKAIGVKIASPTANEIPKTHKPKRGIMDNIGDIFECSHDIPAKPKRFKNT